MPFNEILARERKVRGLNQEDLAARIQVSRQAVSKWETGDAMPDLNKLLALADALDISLDTLCGRDVPPAAPVPQAEPPAKKRSSLPLFLCALLLGCLITGGLWGWSQRNIVPAEESVASSALAALPDDFTVSGVGFSGQSDCRVAYQFTPSISGEDYTYQITFTDSDGVSSTFDASYSGGVCSGIAVFDNCYSSYSVTVSVSNGSASRNLAVAMNLHVSEVRSDWTPLTD